MTVVIADESLHNKLANITEMVEVHDAVGNLLGFFSPRQWEEELLYQHARRVFDLDEIRRRATEEMEGFSIEQVMQHIQSLEKPS